MEYRELKKQRHVYVVPKKHGCETVVINSVIAAREEDPCAVIVSDEGVYRMVEVPDRVRGVCFRLTADGQIGVRVTPEWEGSILSTEEGRIFSPEMERAIEAAERTMPGVPIHMDLKRRVQRQEHLIHDSFESAFTERQRETVEENFRGEGSVLSTVPDPSAVDKMTSTKRGVWCRDEKNLEACKAYPTCGCEVMSVEDVPEQCDSKDTVYCNHPSCDCK